jgi:hypothetical protein
MDAAQFRDALERALADADRDERRGPLLSATKMRLRFVFTDLGLELNLAAESDGTLRWTFGEVPWEPKLTLTMDSETAHRYLLGRESLAIAVAHGQVRVRGESRAALLYLPATRLLCDPYRRAVEGTVPAVSAG